MRDLQDPSPNLPLARILLRWTEGFGLINNLHYARVSVLAKCVDRVAVLEQKVRDILAWAVAALEPDDFWRGAVEHRKLMKIRILRNYCEAMITGVAPQRAVIGGLQTDASDMLRTGKCRFDVCQYSER
jgi:hypothetical protein